MLLHTDGCIKFLFFKILDLSVGLVSVLTDILWKTIIGFHGGVVLCKLIKFLQVNQLCVNIFYFSKLKYWFNINLFCRSLWHFHRHMCWWLWVSTGTTLSAIQWTSVEEVSTFRSQFFSNRILNTQTEPN